MVSVKVANLNLDGLASFSALLFDSYSFINQIQLYFNIMACEPLAFMLTYITIVVVVCVRKQDDLFI